MNFIQTKMLLEINYNNGGNTVYYTFTAPKFIDVNYFHIIERKNYYVQGLYSGDIIRYYKDGITVEYVNTVTKETKILNDRTFKIYEQVEC